VRADDSALLGMTTVTVSSDAGVAKEADIRAADEADGMKPRTVAEVFYRVSVLANDPLRKSKNAKVQKAIEDLETRKFSDKAEAVMAAVNLGATAISVMPHKILSPTSMPAKQVTALATK
jgi:hypothetical protein